MSVEAEAEQQRSSGGGSSSPEFEFCMVGGSSFLTADELFVDGVLRPLLHQLPRPRPHPTTTPNNQPDSPTPTTPPPPIFHSKRWKALYRAAEQHIKERRNRERNGGSTELNIHIWPFARSRSAGNPLKPKAAAAAASSHSAPCSRSNSCGDSNSTNTKKSSSLSWVGGLQNGIHLGRSRPVWHLRRTNKAQQESSSSATKEKSKTQNGGGGGGVSVNNGVRVLNLNVNTCIGGYRNNSVVVKDVMAAGDDDHDAAASVVNARIFRFRAMFSKKVYY